MAFLCFAGADPDADKDLRSPSSPDMRLHPAVLHASKAHKAPTSERGGTGSRGPRGRQIDPAGRREPGNRGERVIVISRQGNHVARKTRIFLQHVHVSLDL